MLGAEFDDLTTPQRRIGRVWVERVNSTLFCVTIRALLRHAHQHKYAQKVFGHDDMAVSHEARLVHVIIVSYA
jgi:hypothetical protein